MGDSLVAIAFGVGMLWVFYRAVQMEWPDSYMSVDSSGLQYAIVSHPLRYVAFRFFPVYLICVFIAVLLDRADTDAVAAVLAVCVIHLAMNNAVAAWKQRRDGRRTPLLVMHALVAIGVLLAGLLALVTRTELARFVPSLDELGATLWTAAFAAVLGVFILGASRADRSAHTALTRSRESIPTALYAFASQEALTTGTDAILVQAIMVVENMQRPKWFRTCERWKGKVFKSGTYGIMQVASTEPLTDEESIALAVRSAPLQGLVVPLKQYAAGQSSPDYEALKLVAVAYNPSVEYANAVVNAYSTLWASRKH